MFDGELLFHNGCRPIIVLRAWTDASHAEMAQNMRDWFDELFPEEEFRNPDRERWRALLEAGQLEALADALDATWRASSVTAYALLLDNDLPRLVEILRCCGGSDNGWCE